MKNDDINDTLRAKGPDAVRERYDRAHKRKTIADIHTLFSKWFGSEYDTATIDAVLAVAAAEKFPGDPPWLLVISGPGNAKTETVGSVSGTPGSIIVSTITSEGALLSGVSKKARAKGSTGGLLRQLGERGILIIKDFTSILSADRNLRSPMLAALREIHDGKWVRSLGSDGGMTYVWEGRIIVLAACTTAWDSAYGVIATMGDRFVTIRSSARTGRGSAGTRALRNTGVEGGMRSEINEAVAALLKTVVPREYPLSDDETNRLVAVADIVTLARTAVETDHMGNVIDAHEPEMPTRFVKQLVMIFRGALAIGLSRSDAFALVERCARDSVPPLRLAVLRDVENNDLEDCRVADIAKRLDKPWHTIDRTLQALHVLQLLKCVYVDKKKAGEESSDDRKTVRHYSLASGVCLDALDPSKASPKL
jgi:hypothetical protein